MRLGRAALAVGDVLGPDARLFGNVAMSGWVGEAVSLGVLSRERRMGHLRCRVRVPRRVRRVRRWCR
jgi:hypothetical protein